MCIEDLGQSRLPPHFPVQLCMCLPLQSVLWSITKANFHGQADLAHADLMRDLLAVAAFLGIIASLAVFVVREYERSRQLRRRSRFLDRFFD